MQKIALRGRSGALPVGNIEENEEKQLKIVLVELPSCRSPQLRTSMTNLDVPMVSYMP